MYVPYANLGLQMGALYITASLHVTFIHSYDLSVHFLYGKNWPHLTFYELATDTSL